MKKETIKTIISPDGKYKILFSDFKEITMMNYEGNFSVVDNNETIIADFEPIKAISNRDICWTEDSSCFAIAVRYFEYGYLLVQLPELKIAFIKMKNPHPLDICFDKRSLVVSYNNEQLLLSNTDKLFGGGTTQMPYKQYLKPNDLVFKLDDLNFYSRNNLINLGELTEEDKNYALCLIDGGYNKFNGTYPQDTVHGFNRRAFEVYQLEAFAEYGDKVSQLWLDEIKHKTNNTYSRWNKVVDYIGYRKRTDEEKLLYK